MDKVEKLEKRIDELEKKLTPNWKILSKSVLTEWDENYRTAFEQQYSFPKGHKFERFDIEKLINGIPNNAKTPQKLKYWEGVYNDLKQTLGNRYGKQWPDLCYIVEMAVRFYQNEIMEYILKEGKYVDDGGRPQTYDKRRIIELWEKYDPQKGEIMNTYHKIADEIGVDQYLSDRTKRISQIVREYKKK